MEKEEIKNKIKSKSKNKVEEAEAKIIDAAGKTLGRLASQVAVVLIGKNKASYQRHIYSGTPVKVINSNKLKITNKKLDSIYHTRYSGNPGGLKILTGTYTVEKKGFKELVRLSVYSMLPDNKLKKTMMKNLEIE
jgi:large subunit ribosomal protein L13